MTMLTIIRIRTTVIHMIIPIERARHLVLTAWC